MGCLFLVFVRPTKVARQKRTAVVFKASFKSDGHWKWIGPTQQLLSAVGCLNFPASPSTVELGSAEQMGGSVKQAGMVDSLVSTIISESRCLPTTFTVLRK